MYLALLGDFLTLKYKYLMIWYFHEFYDMPMLTQNKNILGIVMNISYLCLLWFLLM